MILRLDMASDVPIYQQIRNQIVLGIGSGKLKPNESLPSVRQLAEDTGVNSMTVNKAYTLLKNEGYIVIDRRQGARIRPEPENGLPNDSFIQKLEMLAAEAFAMGISKQDFLTSCKKAADSMNREGGR
ncbi:MAG: GntR family transcriptional regulator [Candidatus Merdivicinus sp.]